MKHLAHLRRACAALLKPLALGAVVALAPAASAQGDFNYGGGPIQPIVDDLVTACHDEVETFIAQTLVAPDYQQADFDKDGRLDRADGVGAIKFELHSLFLTSPVGVPPRLQDFRTLKDAQIDKINRDPLLGGAAMPTKTTRVNLLRCLYNRRIAQLEGTTLVGDKPAASAAPVASTPAPAQAGGAAFPLPDSKLGPEARKALSEILAPGARPAPSFFEKTDFAAWAEGGPSNPASKKDQATAKANYNATKTRKLHNRLNDVTPCLAVDPTGVRQEWGMEGRFRIRNTCSFPVEASWCANKKECDTGRGNLWKLPPKGTWPIYFADVANPVIGIGGCRTEADRRPLPSDGAIAAAGGIDTSHKQPMPYPGVSAMPNHRCD